MSKNLNTPSNFPDAITKRDLLHGRKKSTTAQKVTLGTNFAEAGWLSDAIDFLTTEPAELEKIKVTAIKEGDTFLLAKIFRTLGQENLTELLDASVKAEELGKIRYAIKGYEKLGKEDKVTELKARISQDGDMKTALNSVFIPKSEEERSDEDGE